LPHEETVRVVPQLSGAVTLPQSLPSRVQNWLLFSGVHPHTFAVPPPPHVCGSVHVPQLAVRGASQWSVFVTVPQFFPSRVQKAASLSAVQPQTLGAPPPPHV
jgi:hypothetical protein